MNSEQLEKIRTGSGFIAALDQSGGSTPKALKAYGIEESQYNGDDEMFDRIHEMRTRIVTSQSFSGSRILGAILFENTMDRSIDGMSSSDYLWSVKGVVPFLKVDKGLADEQQGVQVMKPIDGLDVFLIKPQKIISSVRKCARLLNQPTRMELTPWWINSSKLEIGFSKQG